MSFKEENKTVIWSLGWVLIILFVLGAAGIGYMKVFGLWRESIRREIVEESRAHVVGSNQHLGRLLREYAEADEIHKSGLAEMILFEADTIPSENLTPRIRSLVAGLRR